MTVAVLTAIGDPRREAELMAGFHDADLGVTVVRRCVDVADLLAAAEAGLAQAALVSADLRRLDRVCVLRLLESGMAVVAITPDDIASRDRLRRLGIEWVVADTTPVAGIAAAVVAAAAGPQPDADGRRPAKPVSTTRAVSQGRVVAVWGPAGAPGRSTVAVNLAAELAAAGRSTLCVDLDTYGASLAQLLGVLDEGSGVAAACRAANGGSLDASALRRMAVEVRPRLRLLSGITASHRWPELRPSSLDVLLERAREGFQLTVVDVGFCVEQDEELSYDTVAPRRNGAAIAVIAQAEQLVAVAGADPVGIARFARAVGDLPRDRESTPPITVVNRVRRAAIGRGDPAQQIALALGRYADIGNAVMVSDDPATADGAIATGRTWAEVSPGSPARLAVRDLARRVSGDAVPAPVGPLLQIRAKLLARH